MRFTKPKKIIGLDIGTHSVKAIQMSKTAGKLHIDDVGYALVDRNQVSLDPTAAQANAVRAAISTMPVNQCMIAGALPGQAVVIRYPRLPDMAADQLNQAVEGEAAQNIPYDLFEVFLQWHILEKEGEGDEKQLKILLVAAKHEVIDARIQIANAAEIDYGVLGVDSLALADAAESCDFLRTGETVALIDIGASASSIHFVKSGISNFVRDVTWGARELVQTIAKVRRCEYDEAEGILFNIEEEIQKDNAVSETRPESSPDLAETKVEELRETETSGSSSGSLLDPLDDELEGFGQASPEAASTDSGIMGNTVGMAGMATEEETSITEALSLPISKFVSEIRRSFDYYEHQLYESPVDRIVLSGGVAHVSLIRKTLMEDLGVDTVMVGDPHEGPFEIAGGKNVPEFESYPGLFMVALGLAARSAVAL